MNNLTVTEYKNIRVLTTQQIAETNGKNGYVPKADKILLIANHFNVPLEKFIEP